MPCVSLPIIEQAVAYQLCVVGVTGGQVINSFHSSRAQLVIVFDWLRHKLACRLAIQEGNLFVEPDVEQKGIFLLQFFQATAKGEQEVEPGIMLHEMAHVLKDFGFQFACPHALLQIDDLIQHEQEVPLADGRLDVSEELVFKTAARIGQEFAAI